MYIVHTGRHTDMHSFIVQWGLKYDNFFLIISIKFHILRPILDLCSNNYVNYTWITLTLV